MTNINGTGLGEQQPGGAHRRLPGLLRRALLKPDHRHGNEPHDGEHVGGSGHRLRVEEVRDEQQVREEDHHDRVAAAVHLEQLEREHEHQHCHARVATEQAAIVKKDAD